MKKEVIGLIAFVVGITLGLLFGMNMTVKKYSFQLSDGEKGSAHVMRGNLLTGEVEVALLRLDVVGNWKMVEEK